MPKRSPPSTALFDEAQAAGEPDRTAMVVATAALDARPSARTVLLKAHDARGFVFYTHLDGRKGRELQANPHAALLFLWPRVRGGVQVRIEGAVEIVDDAEADAYFASRPRGSQVGAWASMQSETLSIARDVRAAHRRGRARVRGSRGAAPAALDRTARARRRRIEFWYGADFRLHERWLYEVRLHRRMVEADAVSVSAPGFTVRAAQRSGCARRGRAARWRCGRTKSRRGTPRTSAMRLGRERTARPRFLALRSERVPRSASPKRHCASDYVNGTDSFAGRIPRRLVCDAAVARHAASGARWCARSSDWTREQGCTRARLGRPARQPAARIAAHAACGFEETERVVYFRKALDC